MASSSTLTLHEYHSSGNCYKIRLTASILNIPLCLVQHDVNAGASKTKDFLTNISPTGAVPILQISHGSSDSRSSSGRASDTFLPESNAIISYLAHGTHLIPTDRLQQAQMLRWLFFEQYDIEPNIAVLRRWKSMIGEAHLTPLQKELMPGKTAAGRKALGVMEGWLEQRERERDSSAVFFVGEGLSLADISLFAYTHVAADAGFDLKEWPRVSAWLERVRGQKGFVSIDA